MILKLVVCESPPGGTRAPFFPPLLLPKFPLGPRSDARSEGGASNLIGSALGTMFSVVHIDGT